ncbi:hypothetical protein [Rhodopila sp.]|uniref:hypothetical protein n=1 Tax=Rhodopila sp. TaxID=2480087 RepID=UPI003D1224A0
MNTVIQPRHTKLWLGGNERNWAYADHERHIIGGVLARIATAIPDFRRLNTLSRQTC